MSTYSEANEIEFFNDCLDQLTTELLRRDIDQPDRWSHISEEQLRKSAWIASILASSDDDEHRKKALAFGILAYLRKRESNQKDLYERYLYIILSRVGDLPAVGNLVDDEEREEFETELISSFDSVLSTEMETYRQFYGVGDGDYLSEFQTEIFQALTDGKDVAISGPTSSGKSFILQRYIRDRIASDDSFEIIYVVPSRALISEVSSDLKDIYDDVTVKTGAYFSDTADPDDNVFLIVTPERCLKLLRDDMKDKIDPSLIFFDELQNVEDGERGVLFENIIESLYEMWPGTQMVAAGPYLDNPAETLERITDNEVVEVKTVFTPIFQLKVILTFQKQHRRKNRQLKVTVLSPSGSEEEFTIAEPENLTFSDVKGNKTRALTEILKEFGEDDQNLVYAGRKNLAEGWAENVAKGREERPLSDRTITLTDFLSTAIHEDYSLVSCLKRGVAFHHRMVPKIAREEIEDIYREESDIDTIISTPTLLEGVNLPAKNIFVLDPSKGRENLSDFDFKNLIGRVGRLHHRLYGTIYCIQTEEDEWSKDKLTDSADKEIEGATDKALQSETDEFIDIVDKENIYEVEESHHRYTGILLRNKHLKGGHDLENYLNKKEVEKEDIDQIQSKLDTRLNNISIPESILRRNPTVDPIQQNKLFKRVRRNPEDWIVAKNRNAYSYDDFYEVARNLNEVFLFTNDRERDIAPPERETSHGDIQPITITANLWLRGEPYRMMINERQTNENIDDGDVDTSIRKVMELINEDVRFVLVKYFRILTDILEEIDAPAGDWMLQFDQMLEMGSIDFNELELMAEGVDRTVVIDLPIPRDVDDVFAYLQENEDRISPFYRDHLQDQDIL